MMASGLDRALGLLNALVMDEHGTRWGERATEIQRADARALLDLDGVRKHWLGRSRGYAKTDDLAAVSLAALPTQLSTGMEAIGIAADRDQARLLVDHMRPIVQRTPELRDVQVGAYDVRAGNVRFEVLPADAASAWGRSPAWTVVDELCQWPDTPNARTMWQAISTAVPKVRGRVAIITTAGDPAHWSRGVYEHAVEDRLWRVSEVHGPAPWLDREELESERRRLPDSAWQRFFENRWCATEDRLLSYEDIQACAVLPGRLDSDPRYQYVLGVDLAVRGDNTVVAVCHLEEVEGYGDRRVVVDSLDVFTPTKRSETDLQAVEGCVQARSEQYGHAPAMFDPAQGFQMMQRLRAAGLRVLEHTFTAQSNSRRALLILELVRGRRLWLPDDPETVAEFASVRLRETAPGVYRYDHDSGKHDDRVTAISLAAVHLLGRPAVSSHAPIFAEEPSRSRWDPDGSVFGPPPVHTPGASGDVRRVMQPDPDADEDPPAHYVAAYKGDERLARAAWKRFCEREAKRRQAEGPPSLVTTRPSRHHLGGPIGGPGGGV
jgi:hypothetical protein